MAQFRTQEQGSISFTKSPAERAGSDAALIKGIGNLVATGVDAFQAQQKRERENKAESQATEETRELAEDVGAASQAQRFGIDPQDPFFTKPDEEIGELEVQSGIGPDGVQVSFTQNLPEAPENQQEISIQRKLGEADSRARRLALSFQQGKSTQAAVKLAAQKDFQDIASRFPGFEQEIAGIFQRRLGFDPRGAGSRILMEGSLSGPGGGGARGEEDFLESQTINGVPISTFSPTARRAFASKLASTGNKELAARFALDTQAHEIRAERIKDKAKKGDVDASRLQTEALNAANGIINETMVEVAAKVEEQGGLKEETIRGLKQKVNTKFQAIRQNIIKDFQEINEGGGFVKQSTQDEVLATLNERRKQFLQDIEDKDLQSLLSSKRKTLEDASKLYGWKAMPTIKFLNSALGGDTGSNIIEMYSKFSESERERFSSFFPGASLILEGGPTGDDQDFVPKGMRAFIHSLTTGAGVPTPGEEGPGGQEFTRSESNQVKASLVKSLSESGKVNKIDTQNNLFDALRNTDDKLAFDTLSNPQFKPYFTKNSERKTKARQFVANRTNSIVGTISNLAKANDAWDISYDKADNKFIIAPTGESEGGLGGALGVTASELTPSDELQAAVDSLNQTIGVYENLGESVLGESATSFGQDTAERINNRIAQNRGQQQQGEGAEEDATAIMQQSKSQLRKFEGTSKAQSNLTRTILINGEQRKGPPFRDGKFFPFKDSRGNWTIGFGHKITEEQAQRMSEGIDQERANKLFESDFQSAVSQAQSLIAERGIDLPPSKQAVITQMVFQMGKAGVAEFTDMWAALENQDFNRAADEILDSQFANQTEERAAKLAQQMRSS